MQTSINVCGYIADAQVNSHLAQLCALEGWHIWHWDQRDEADVEPRQLPMTADIIFSDRVEILHKIEARSGAHLMVLLASPASGESPDHWLEIPHDDHQLVQTLTTALNVARFDSQFFSAETSEPITKLPRHPELLHFINRFRGTAMGLLVMQIDHADHLYTNLDPVSRTDLLGSISDYLLKLVPSRAHLGIFDATCFVVWVPQSAPSDMHQLSAKLNQVRHQSIHFGGGQIHITFSIGWSHNASMNSPQTIWQAAWSHKERAVGQGGNSIISDTESQPLTGRISGALERDEFSLVLQPQYQLDGSGLTGVESLLRWEGVEVGNLAPDHFIPLVERDGQMARIGDWVLERSTCESATWLEHLVTPIKLGINTSPQQFVHDSIKSQIQRLASDNWVDPNIIELELTHDNLLQVVDQNRTTLYELRDMGVRIAIDNLGLGIVDTTKLLRCPADTLKIDRSIIAKIQTSEQARALVDQICRVGHRFSLRVVAVGVETEAQRNLLIDLGCTEAQGYLFAEPIPLERFHRYLVDPKYRLTYRHTRTTERSLR
ncbi:MAG: EAL domain-containing protein [Pseudomonadota bacterium]